MSNVPLSKSLKTRKFKGSFQN